MFKHIVYNYRTPATAPIEERQTAFGPDVMINCWTPLIPVRVENGAMKMIPGSHKLGIQVVLYI